MVKNVSKKTCQLTLVDFNWLTLAQELALEGYSGVLYELKCELAEKFGASVEDLDAPTMFPGIDHVAGDIYFPDADTTLYVKVIEMSASEKTSQEEGVFDDPGKTDSPALGDYKIEVGEISQIGADEGEWMNSLVGAVDTYLLSHGAEKADIKWIVDDGSGGAQAPFEGETVSLPDKRATELAHIVRDGKLDDFFQQFEEEKDSLVLSEFLTNVTNRDEIEYYIDKLFEHELIQEQVVVYCKKTNMPTIRAKDRAALDALSSSGILCSCGAPLKSEEIKRLVLMPAQNRAMTTKEWAAQTFLISMLTKMGYPLESISIKSVDDQDLVYLPAEGNSLIFALSPKEYTEDMALKAWDFIEEVSNPKIILYGDGGVQEGAVEALGTRAGQGAVVLSMDKLDDFSNKLLDALNHERIERIRQVFNDFQKVLPVNVGNLAVKRLS